MLKITRCPEWTHEVTISVPVDGGFENQSCLVRFRLIDETPGETDPLSLARSVVVRMDDLADEAGTALAWSDAVRDQVLALPFVQSAVLRGYYRSVAGAREGNSAGSALPGRRAG